MSMQDTTQVGRWRQQVLPRDGSWRIDAGDATDCPSWKRVNTNQHRKDCELTPRVPGKVIDALQPFFRTIQPLNENEAHLREMELTKRRKRFKQCCRPVDKNMEEIGVAYAKKIEDDENAVDETRQSKWARTVTAEAAKGRKNRWSEISVAPTAAFEGKECRRQLATVMTKACRPVQSNWGKSCQETPMLPLKAINPSDPVWGHGAGLPGGSPHQHKVLANSGRCAERLSDLSLSTSTGLSAPDLGHSSVSVVDSLFSVSTSSAGPQQFDISTDDLDEEEASYFPE